MAENDVERARAGLCASCAQCRLIRSDRGSLFYQCMLSFTDARFTRYPPLPVLICAGYVRVEGEQHEQNRDRGST